MERRVKCHSHCRCICRLFFPLILFLQATGCGQTLTFQVIDNASKKPLGGVTLTQASTHGFDSEVIETVYPPSDASGKITTKGVRTDFGNTFWFNKAGYQESAARLSADGTSVSVGKASIRVEDIPPNGVVSTAFDVNGTILVPMYRPDPPPTRPSFRGPVIPPGALVLPSSTRPATTRTVMSGRDTPESAMNLLGQTLTFQMVDSESKEPLDGVKTKQDSVNPYWLDMTGVQVYYDPSAADGRTTTKALRGDFDNVFWFDKPGYVESTARLVQKGAAVEVGAMYDFNRHMPAARAVTTLPAHGIILVPMYRDGPPSTQPRQAIGAREFRDLARLAKIFAGQDGTGAQLPGGKTQTLPSTRALTTVPVTAGRDTPAGAMNVLERAVDEGDLATVADSFDLPKDADRLVRQVEAVHLIVNRRFYKAVEKRFGPDGAYYVRLHSRILGVGPFRPYTAAYWPGFVKTYWQVSPNKDIVGPARFDFKTDPIEQGRTMHRGADGIWRMGFVTNFQRELQTVVGDPKLYATRLDDLARAVSAGKYATPDEIVQAWYWPDPTPDQKSQSIEKQQQQRQNADVAELNAAKFDPSTLSGAVGMFMQATQKKDLAAMSNYFYSDGDPDGNLARANAHRVLAVSGFYETVLSKMESAAALIGEFKMLSKIHLPAMMEETPDQYRRINGIWKLNVTPPGGQSPAEEAKKMESVAQAVDQITAGLLAGKYQTVDQVRTALIAAGVSAGAP